MKNVNVHENCYMDGIFFFMRQSPVFDYWQRYITMLSKLYFLQTFNCIFLFGNGDRKKDVVDLFWFCVLFFQSLALNLYHDKYLSWMKDGSEYSE